MSFFSDERASELRDLFFESAQELLQALNEEGLELEKRPGDAEIIRTVRRTVHTLKGDSAACGFKELSELAHALEDVLTPEMAQGSPDAVAQLVLSAADVFDGMLSAYRNNLQPPESSALLEMIGAVSQQPAPGRTGFKPNFNWSEYQQLVIQQEAKGQAVFNVGVAIDPQCPMRAAAVQLVRNVLQEAGAVLVIHPDSAPDSTGDPAPVEAVEAAVASSYDQEWIARKCRIPAVVADVIVAPLSMGAEVPSDAANDPAPLAVIGEPSLCGGGASLSCGGGAVPRPGRVEDLPPHKLGSPPPHDPQPAQSENILRIDAERVDAVLNLLGEMITAKSMLQQTMVEFARRFPKDPLRGRFADVLAHQAQVLNELQRSVMKIRMVPVGQLFRRFPRVVRDVAKQCGKEAELVTSGQETELDKSILDLLAEPLSHLVRNAVDHGLEPASERLSAGKTAQGTVRLDAYHQGNQVVIEICDDGRGIERTRVIAKALETGIVTHDEIARMPDAEILQLIFEPGFSTADQVTTVSGRGVGLDVVKTVLEGLKGSVSVQSKVGEGTTFQLRVPLTLAIIKALLFQAGGKLYAVPLSTVLEIARATEAEIHRVDNHEVVQLRNEVLTLVRLSRLSPLGSSQSRKAFIIVIAQAGRKFGLIVDRLVGEQELVIKALDDQLVSTELVSGAAILGDGTVVLVLNTSAVVDKLGRVRSAVNEAWGQAGAPQLPSQPGQVATEANA